MDWPQDILECRGRTPSSYLYYYMKDPAVLVDALGLGLYPPITVIPLERV